MPKEKLDLPEKLKENDTFRLCDAAWSIIFAEYWVVYRRTASFINIATLRIVERKDNTNYVAELMEVVPEEGRVQLPLGMKIDTTLHQIHLAIALNHAKKTGLL